MTETDDNLRQPQATVDAGGWLRMTREQSGLSIDAVAQQLKLAPRQVRALEDGDFAVLPGRTFVRGFVRNYARVLKLDPEAVVAALPGVDTAPALEGPSIGSTSRPMGELPVAHPSRAPSWSRWAIPAALVAFVVVGAVYEFTRREAATVETNNVVKAPPADPIGPLPGGGTPLPNPVAGALTSPEGHKGSPEPAQPAPAPPASAPTSSAPVDPANVLAASAGPSASSAGPGPGEATLVIRYNKKSWTQVRDAAGQSILITEGEPGGAATAHGKPPLDVVIGNASDTSITWRGQPFDLAPHIKGNVARVRLP